MIGRNKVIDRAPEPQTLSTLLDELRTIDWRIANAPLPPEDGEPVPRTPYGDSHDIGAIQKEGEELLARMAHEVLPVGHWIQHRRELLYLQSYQKRTDNKTRYALHRIPARWVRWIPTDREESPFTTVRRAEYTHWRRRVAVGKATTLALLMALLTSAIYTLGWPLISVLALATLISWAATKSHARSALQYIHVVED